MSTVGGVYLRRRVLLLAEVFLGSLRVGLHRVLARFPPGWTDLSVFIGKLEGLDQSQRLVYRSTDGQIVNRDLTQNS